MKRIWIAQCLCPSRHCIIANVGEADGMAEAQKIEVRLRGQLRNLLEAGAMNPWCAICDATLGTWKTELACTKFETLAESAPTLAKTVAENFMANAMFGDLHRRGKPN